MKLREYQQGGLDAPFTYWRNGGMNPIVEMATGLGKSLVNAAIFQKFQNDFPKLRGMMLTHRKELIEQNYRAALKLCPTLDVGIYSAGLGQRKHRNRYVFAGIQSVHSKAKLFTGVNFIVIDECHLLNPKEATMYTKFIAALREQYPDLRVVGLTATPYRLDSGPLVGNGQLFDQVVYTYNIKNGIDDGWLTPLTTLGVTNSSVNLEDVGIRGGEFVQSDLLRSVADPVMLGKTVSDFLSRVIPGPSLVFCCGVDHAHDIKTIVEYAGKSVEIVTGDTDKDERASVLERFKRGDIDFLCNCDVLTTGFDAANLTNVIVLRPTMSVGLFVQMVGRGTRLAPELAGPINNYKTAEERKGAIARSSKPVCNVLDYGGNLRRHGPVDRARTGKEERPREDKPAEDIVICTYEDCGAVASKEDWEDNGGACPQCGRMPDFYSVGSDDSERSSKNIEHDTESDMQSRLISTEAEASGWRRVIGWEPFNWDKRRFDPNKIPTLKVTYYADDGTDYSEWICLQHEPGTFPHNKAVDWWGQHSDGNMPSTTKEALECFKVNMFEEATMTCPHFIRVEREDKYWRIIDRHFDETLPGNVQEGAAW